LVVACVSADTGVSAVTGGYAAIGVPDFVAHFFVLSDFWMSMTE